MLTVEAVHIANQLCQYGYFFPVNDSKTLTVRDDSSLYRFQVPYLSLLRLTIESKFETGIYYHHHLYTIHILCTYVCYFAKCQYEKQYEKSFPIRSKTHFESDIIQCTMYNQDNVFAYNISLYRKYFASILFQIFQRSIDVFSRSMFQAKYYKYQTFGKIFYRFFTRKININIGKNFLYIYIYTRDIFITFRSTR